MQTDKNSKETIPNLPPCEYGINCYRKNPNHFREYSHPPGFKSRSADGIQMKTLSFAIEEHEDNSNKLSTSDNFDDDIFANPLPPCKYGMQCYRKNTEHLQQYSHPSDFNKTILSKKHPHLIRKQFQTSINDTEEKYKNAEEQRKKLEEDLSLMTLHHQELKKTLEHELEKYKERELEQKQMLSIRRDIPHYSDQKILEIPYLEVNIPSNSIEFNIISQLLNDTIEIHDNAYGTINGKDPTDFIVTNIRRIYNNQLWHKYCFEKEHILKKNKGNIPQCDSSKYLKNHPFVTPLLDENANEYWLFHGCSQSVVSLILNGGCDPRVSNLDGMFGGGFYLAENSSKSNQYIPCPGCEKNSIGSSGACQCQNQESIQFSILICRVILGDAHVALKFDEKKYKGEGSKRVRRPPLKENSTDLYDSVLGECRKYNGNALRYREVIIYDADQAYPEYVIEFRRSITNPRQTSGARNAKEACYRFLKNPTQV